MIEFVEVLANNLDSHQIYPFLVCLVRFASVHKLEIDLMQTLLRKSVLSGSEPLLRADSAVTRLVGCFFLQECAKWFHDCLADFISVLNVKPNDLLSDEEIDRHTEMIFENLVAFSGSMTLNIAVLLQWTFVLVEQIDPKMVQPVIGNVILLRGMNRAIIHPSHLKIGQESWNVVQCKNCVKLAKSLMKEAPEKSFGKFVSAIPTYEGIVKKKMKREKAPKLVEEENKYTLQRSLKTFRNYISKYLGLFWDNPRLRPVLQELTKKSLQEIPFTGEKGVRLAIE